MRRLQLLLLAVFLTPAVNSLIAAPLGAAFTYQGRLTDAGQTANGIYVLRFVIYDDSAGPVVVGGPLTNSNVVVSNGVFAVTLDFGSGVFDGNARWLEIGVRTNGVQEFAPLTPRQQLTAAPYAQFAPTAGNAATASGVSGTVSTAQLTGTISSNNIGAGSITTTMLAAGSVTAVALADHVVTAGKIFRSAEIATQMMITNPAPSNDDEFGLCVAAIGADLVLVGAPFDDTGAVDAGTAYLFNTQGTVVTVFTNPAHGYGDNFGCSIAPVGSNRVVIGSIFADAGLPGVGAAYLFDLAGNLTATFANPTPSSMDGFGVAVAGLGDNRVVIGAPGDNSGPPGGAAYLFNTNGALLTTFTNPTPGWSDWLGYAVAGLGTDRVIIGAYGDDEGAVDSGAAYLFNTNGALLATFTNPVPVAGAWFGRAVAAVGTDRVLVGAPYSNAGATNAGAAFLFNTNGAWLATFTNPAPANLDRFGLSVAGMEADRVLVGAYTADTAGADAGAVFLFATDGTLLAVLTNSIVPSYTGFGISVAAAGTDRVLVGAPYNDSGATDAGAVFLFNLRDFMPGLIAESVRNKAIGTASLGDGVVTGTKIASGAVTAGLLASNAVGSSALALGAVTSAKIATGAVGTEQISAGAVQSSNIVAGAVGTAQLAAGAVLSSNIATGAVGTAQLAAGAVQSSNIVAGAIGTTQLASGAVTSNVLAAGAVRSGHVSWGTNAGQVSLDTVPDGLARFIVPFPAGMVVPYAGTNAPPGWLLCQGQSLNPAAYPALFAAIGTTYGGNGSSTFLLPDLRGRSVFGKDNMGGVTAGRVTTAGSGVDGTSLGASGGTEAVTLTEPQIPSHNHTVADPGHNHSYWDPGHYHSYSAPTRSSGSYLAAGSSYNVGSYSTPSGVSGVGITISSGTTGISLGTTGGGNSHNNLPPAVIMNYIIKY